jgi:hypothetical protein
MSSPAAKRPDLKVFCVYHDDVAKTAEERGYIDPNADHVVYVKVRPHPYSYPCRHHLDLHSQKWFKPLGPRYAEGEVMLALYRAAKAKLLALPEYVGLAHYDMRLIQYDPTTPLNLCRVIVFCPYPGSEVMSVPCHSYILDLYVAMMRYHGIDPTRCKDRMFAMANAFIAHRDVFMSIMAEVDAYVVANNGFPTPACLYKKRDIGEAIERLVSVLIARRNMEEVYCRLHHALATACHREL